jgi:hypothetical protein
MKMLDYFYQNKTELMINGLNPNTAYLTYRNRLFKYDSETGIIYEYDKYTLTRCNAVAFFAYDNIFPIKK